MLASYERASSVAPAAGRNHGETEIAVLIPCYNEESTIAQVVREFRTALPSAIIYVFDNNSKDGSIEVARGAGAVVRRVADQGKGSVVRRMFGDVEADVYVLADGDATYHAPSAAEMVSILMRDQLDMVVGVRVDSEAAAYRPGHRTGNWLLTSFVASIFASKFTDMLSGYRVFSRRFVKSLPVLSNGFEIETEFTIHALDLGLPVAEVRTPYGARPKGSTSKLNTWRDGFRILRTIVKLFRLERPLAFFGAIGIICAICSIILAIPVFLTFIETGLVPRIPTALLSTGLMLAGFLFFVAGLILDTVTRGRREMKLLAYHQFAAPAAESWSPISAVQQ
jgi:glycosyltransferase involved in cell wall biosynthesis